MSLVSAKKALLNFLQEKKICKGQEYTHTSMGKPFGSYNFSNVQKLIL